MLSEQPPDLNFVYEDEHLFVLEKPPAIHSVAQGRSVAPSLADRLLQWNSRLAKASLKEGDAGLVQRLDFETSGLILGAKDRDTWSRLFSMVKSGAITKYYLALVEGALQGPQKIMGSIGSPRRRAKKVRVYSGTNVARALRAESEFYPLRYYRSEDLTLVKVKAPTARRHQIRAHAASIDHPLLGDTLYGSLRGLTAAASLLQRAPLPGEHFFLFAESLAFSHPFSKEQLQFKIAPSLIAALDGID